MKAWLTRDSEKRDGGYSVFVHGVPKCASDGMYVGRGDCRCLMDDVNPADFNLAPLAFGECVPVTIQITRDEKGE